MATWKDLEGNVRLTAKTIWGTDFRSSLIHGRQIDAYADIDVRNSVAIEVTELKKIDKIQDDLNKLVHVRNVNFQNSYKSTECICVTAYEPTIAMKNVGKQINVEVLSEEDFRSKFLPFNEYKISRENSSFGSAINPETGKKDERKYIPVRFVDEAGSESSQDTLIKAIKDGEFVVLIGAYGTGKSKFIESAFSHLSIEAWENSCFPVAIDLKRCWGLRDRYEILRRHISEYILPSKVEAFIKAYNDGFLVLLLDGFDEMGVQVWSDNSDTLKALRFDALTGVRDLIDSQKSGTLICGRSHYFDSNDELLSALGLSKKGPNIYYSKDEFSYEEISDFLRNENLNGDIPEWLPRKPLTCEFFVKLFQELGTDIDENLDQVQFWNVFINKVCERESRIHPSFDPETIKQILVEVAGITRTKPENVGPITLAEIQSSFEKAVGHAPIDQASVLLQRLAGLGRSSSDTQDRHFIDTYLLSGLRAIQIINIIETQDLSHNQSIWLNSLDETGLVICGRSIEEFSLQNEAISFVKRASSIKNQTSRADICCSILAAASGKIDFGGTLIDGGYCSTVDFSRFSMEGIQFDNCLIDKLLISEKSGPNVKINNSMISRLEGVSSISGVPSWIVNSSIDAFSSVATISRIRSANLMPSQKVLVTIVRKTFFQPGSARKEEALLRGLGKLVRQGTLDKIISTLMTGNIIMRAKGDSGDIYKPVRKQTKRVSKMLSELTLSSDEIWLSITKLKD